MGKSPGRCARSSILRLFFFGSGGQADHVIDGDREGDSVHDNGGHGSEGNRAERCKEFAAKLHEATGLPVMMTDERLTTVVAAHFLNETNTRGKDRKKVIDSLSAEIILQDTLDRIKRL